ncbi:MAG: hypothetical protein ACRC0V_11535 [Fusobacteriaceae bacterium]
MNKGELFEIILNKGINLTLEQVTDMSLEDLEKAIVKDVSDQMNKTKTEREKTQEEARLKKMLNDRFDKRMRGEPLIPKTGAFWDILEGRKN